MDCLSSVKNYFEQQLVSKIKEFTPLEELLVVIGGSVSYGFADEFSDVDVYILWEVPREVWFKKLQRHLFMHQIINGYRVQFLPLIFENSPYSPLSCLLHEEYDNLRKCDIKLLYDILHYIPVHDPKNIINKGKIFIENLENEFWQEKCIKHCSKHIDVLEVFYSSLKRGNIITGNMYYGDALRGLLEIPYLYTGSPYPMAKWIWSGLEKVDNALYRDLKQIFDNNPPLSCSDLERIVHSVTEIITKKLKEKGFVPYYILEDLLFP